MRQFRIMHEGDIIGYCFAKSAEQAIAGFRKAHSIPLAIHLTAQGV